MTTQALNRHAFALGFVGLALLLGLSLTLLPARQAALSFEAPQPLVGVFPPGTPARISREAIREVGAMPRRELLGGTLVSFIAWHPQQVERLERGGALALALPSRTDFTLGCSVSVQP
ncbi:hypothetical protein ACUY1T_05215 [Billgrantia sp. Q4P2]|uniref:hypothetical protein n=1 Tax=Billgrantia sp. Q4P2 TaxID=3463857 RepID=UPI004056F615